MKGKGRGYDKSDIAYSESQDKKSSKSEDGIYDQTRYSEKVAYVIYEQSLTTSALKGVKRFDESVTQMLS